MAKEVSKKRPKTAAAAGRTRKLTKKQQKAKAKQQVRQRKPVIGSFRLTWNVLGVLRMHWKTLGGIILVYLILNIVFASGISDISSNFGSIKENLRDSGLDGIWKAAGGFALLVGTSGASGSAAVSTLQSALFVIESLAIIWALRHLLSGQSVFIKQAYYSAMTPLIPFLLVLLVIIIQLLPMTIGGAVLATVASSVFPDSGAATAMTTILFVLLAAWSLYMISASIFAAYIVTLPDMQPRQALRSARQLVRFRRLMVIRKVLFMPIFIFIVMALITVPLILYAAAVVPWVFYILSMLAVLFAHTYLYSLYRELLA